MFEKIDILASLDAPALENLVSDNTTAPVSDTTKPPAGPPIRFGAIKIPLNTNPDDPCIRIIELTTSEADKDYIVYMLNGISGNTAYYAELLMLLQTIPATSNVEIYITSPGGSLNTGAMISNAIAASQAQVTTIACGMVASAAALIWSYGKIRKVTDGAMLLFHMSSHFDYGNSEAIRIKADQIVRYVKEVAIDPICSQGLLTEEEAATLIDNRRDILIDSATMQARLETLDV